MKKEIIINILIVLGIILFNILFWKEGAGINVLLFTIFIVLGLGVREKGIFKKRIMQIITLGTLGFAIMVVVNNSLYSKILYIISSILMIGIAQQRSIRFLGYGLFLGCWSIFETPYKMLVSRTDNHKIKINYSKWFYNLKIIILPVIIVFIFFIVYSIANQNFAFIFIDKINSLFNVLFELEISWARVVFTIMAFFFVAGALWKNRETIPFADEKENIERRTNRSKKVHQLITPSPIGLKNEYKIALLTMLMLNILLLILNITDVQHVWLKDVEGMTSYELRANVHQGTYVLIFSIMMAMAVVVYFFRKNLNFYPNNKWLKIASYIWVAQNAILAFSVGIRNIKYIEEYGLAYKRMGVLIFLFLTLGGLITMIFKVKGKKTLYFLLQRNAWIWYAVFWVTGWMNWDVMITKYNVLTDYKGGLDMYFVMRSVSDKNIYILDEYSDVLKERKNGQWTDQDIDDEINRKKKAFKTARENHTWLSWNMIDAKNLKYLGTENK